MERESGLLRSDCYPACEAVSHVSVSAAESRYVGVCETATNARSGHVHVVVRPSGGGETASAGEWSLTFGFF